MQSCKMLGEQPIDQAEYLLVTYSCADAPKQHWIMAMDDRGREDDRDVRIIRLMRWPRELVRTVWPMPW